jgi:hypothetical protein
VEAPKKPEDERFLHDEGWVEDFGGDKGLAGAIADLKVRFQTKRGTQNNPKQTRITTRDTHNIIGVGPANDSCRAGSFVKMRTRVERFTLKCFVVVCCVAATGGRVTGRQGAQEAAEGARGQAATGGIREVRGPALFHFSF